MTRTLTLTLPALLVLAAGCKEEPDPVDTGLDPTETLLVVAPNDPAGIELPDESAFDYYTAGQFTLDHLQGSTAGETYAEDASIICTTGCEDDQLDDGATLYPVDNAFGLIVTDFSNPEVRERDGVYDDGWIGTIVDGDGDSMGVAITTRETDSFKVGDNMGTWCSGLHGEPVKCSTEHYVVLEKVKTCAETIPYMTCDPDTGDFYPGWEDCEFLDDDLDRDIGDLVPSELDLGEVAVGPDYGVSLKDDGKVLYRWGDLMKEPTDMRMVMRLPLPDEWKVDGDVYRVTRAELAVVHTRANSPNDQVRPEDHENEGATGRTPAYEVDAGGKWLSTVDCYQGDGTFIPAGTVLKNPDFADPGAHSEDLTEGYTNAWYRTLDRDPFAWDVDNGKSPRWRLQAPKMGQDLPGFEVPVVNCTPPPLKKEEAKYGSGELTVTHLDLLDFGDEEAPLALSTGWMEPSGQIMVSDTVTENGVELTEDFELSVYVKGEGKAMSVYSAHLYLDFELVD